MEQWRQILRSFSELRGQYPNIATALEMVAVSTKSDLEEVVSVLSMTGVYVPPGPLEDKIRRFIDSAGKTKTVSELVQAVGFTFVISDKEAFRLVYIFRPFWTLQHYLDLHFDTYLGHCFG